MYITSSFKLKTNNKQILCLLVIWIFIKKYSMKNFVFKSQYSKNKWGTWCYKLVNVRNKRGTLCYRIAKMRNFIYWNNKWGTYEYRVLVFLFIINRYHVSSCKNFSLYHNEKFFCKNDEFGSLLLRCLSTKLYTLWHVREFSSKSYSLCQKVNF